MSKHVFHTCGFLFVESISTFSFEGKYLNFASFFVELLLVNGISQNLAGTQLKLLPSIVLLSCMFQDF